MMNNAYGFSLLEVLMSMFLVTCTFLLTVKQQAYVHQVFFELIARQRAFMAVDDVPERI